MNEKNTRIVIGSIAGFVGGGFGAVAGSYDVWVNMLVGGFIGVLTVFLLNGFLPK